MMLEDSTWAASTAPANFCNCNLNSFVQPCRPSSAAQNNVLQACHMASSTVHCLHAFAGVHNKAVLQGSHNVQQRALPASASIQRCAEHLVSCNHFRSASTEHRLHACILCSTNPCPASMSQLLQLPPPPIRYRHQCLLTCVASSCCTDAAGSALLLMVLHHAGCWHLLLACQLPAASKPHCTCGLCMH